MGCRRSVAQSGDLLYSVPQSRRTNPATPSPANIAATAGFGAVAVLADVVASFAWITPGSPDGIPWKLSRPVVGLRAE